MAGPIIRGAIYVLVAIALFFLLFALCIDFGLNEVHLGSDFILELPENNWPFVRVGLIFCAMAAVLFIVERLRRTN